MEFKNYDTLSEAVNDLIKLGYDTDFTIVSDKDVLVCHRNSLELSPEEFEIEHWYHFDDISDPGSDVALFVITSLDKKVKGLVTMAYGTYSDVTKSKIIDKLTIRTKN